MRTTSAPWGIELILKAFAAAVATASITDKVNGQVEVLQLTNNDSNQGKPAFFYPFAAFTDDGTGVKQINWITVLDYPDIVFHPITSAAEPQVDPDVWGHPPIIVYIDTTGASDNVTGRVMAWDEFLGTRPLTTGDPIYRGPKIHVDSDSVNVVFWTTGNEVYLCELYNCVPQRISEQGAFAQ